jgi:hypothetical protein
MGTTTNYALRYPDAGASVDYPRDAKALADDADAALVTVGRPGRVWRSTTVLDPLAGPGDVRTAGITAVFDTQPCILVLEWFALLYNGVTTRTDIQMKVWVDDVEVPGARASIPYGQPGYGDRRDIYYRATFALAAGSHKVQVSTGAAPTGVYWSNTSAAQLTLTHGGPQSGIIS